MAQIYENKHVRAVRIYSECGVFEGLITVTLNGRTLDELNATSRVFLHLESPTVVSGSLGVASSPLAINKSSILFAVELDSWNPSPMRSLAGSDRRQLSRSILSLCVRDFLIEGQVHTMQGGEPLARLFQAGHPFIALTSASVTGPDTELALPFVAVNRNHVLLGQENFRVSTVMESTSPSAADPGISRS